MKSPKYPWNARGILETLRGNNPNKYPTVDEALVNLYKAMLQVIGEEEPGVTNVMIAMEHAHQRQALDKLFE